MTRQPVAYAGTMPGANGGFTMAVFKAEDVPVGTPLYTAPPDEWLSMESAPKDGSEILLWLGSPWNQVETAKWYEPWGTWISGPLPDDPDNEEQYGIGSMIPTGWKPMPVGPKRDAKAQKLLLEEVASAVMPDAWSNDFPVPTRAGVVTFHQDRQESLRIAASVLDRLASWIETQRRIFPAHGWEFAGAIREELAMHKEVQK